MEPRIRSNLDYLKLMFTSREGDRRESILLRQNKGWFHVGGMGHEAISGIAEFLREDDWIFPSYRDRALMLARGFTNYELALAFFAKRDSTSGGRQMPGHYSSKRFNVFSVPTPVGSNLLPATGTAWAMQLEDKNSICVASVGDAATRQGEFYEAISFAIQEKLPVVFLIEDNKYGISTPTEHFYPYSLGGILSTEHMVKVNARHLKEMRDASSEAVERARNGEGPTIIWCDLDRICSHTSSDDHRVYRTPESITEMSERDPIKLLADDLILSGQITEAEWEEIQQEITKQVDEDYQKAEEAMDPRADELLKDCWGEVKSPSAPPVELANDTMVEAINKTFAQAIEDDSKVVFFGQDIEDPKGGVFGLTKGLKTLFPKNVYNSPLAECTILGVAVGMAAYGWKPVFELQFIDFISPGWNQVITNMSSLRWRSFGEHKCPLVVYAPYGAYLPGGSLWHSQSNEALLAHTPGIQVAVPSTPQDAASLLWSAIQSDDPTFVLLPKHLFRKRTKDGKLKGVPFGQGQIVRKGTDVTVVAWGNTVELAEKAAQELGEGVSVEIIDLRSIVPCDYTLITQSIDKTGRLVVLQEDNRTCGFGESIIAKISSDPDKFNLFLSAPQLVSRPDVHIGFNPIYEYAALPSVEQIVKAIRTTME